MTIQFASAARDAMLDALETWAGTAAVMKIYSGAMPANAAAARTGTVGATLTLPSDWMAAASGGSKALTGTWQDSSADASITAGYFTIFKSDGTTVVLQGTITATGGGGDMTLSSTSITSGVPFVVNTFTLTAGNA